MLRTDLIHPPLLEALARCGHGSKVLIADGNYPLAEKSGKDVYKRQELIAADPAFNMTLEELQKTMEPSRYTGRSAVQVEAFLKNVVNPVLKENEALLGVKAEINV